MPGARRCRPRRTTSCGAFLIEALVAVLVFSVAAAGVFSLLANGLRASDNARSRTEASDVAAATLARMSTEDIVTLADRYDALGGGSGFRTLARERATIAWRDGYRECSGGHVRARAVGP